MVGIVLVSHSATLAQGVKELAQQTTQTPVAIATAAGIEDAENPLGTDAMQIYTAIESVYSDAGVVVLMDLGSAVMNAEMALEFLSEEQRQNVKLCSAPFVEGTIAAYITASTDADIETVIESATNALGGKSLQLPENPSSSTTPANQDDDDSFSPETIHLTVTNDSGLHLRPAAQLVTTASQFSAKIQLQNLTTQSQFVDAKSVNQVMLLGVKQGHEIALLAKGEDASLALKALEDLICHHLDESAVSAPVVPVVTSSSSASYVGVPASGGIAIAPVVVYQATLPEIPPQTTDNPQQEWHNLQQAINQAIKHIEELIAPTKKQSTDIFQAYLLYLKDPQFIQQAQQLIFDNNLNAISAWQQIIKNAIASYQKLDDSYLQARATDVEDIGNRVSKLLLGVEVSEINLPEQGILVTPDLTVSEIMALPQEQVKGICTAQGTATSHTALIANQLGIPMIVGLGTEILSLQPQTEIAINGSTGEVWLEPNQEQSQQLREQSNLAQVEVMLEPAVTQDGEQIAVLANIFASNHASQAVELGADGVGLLRTEFMFLERTSAPTEEEQLASIETIATTLPGKPLTIRTLDIGGDKVIPYLPQTQEANPFLGKRGIRYTLANLDLFKTQLRAILRASAKHDLKLMLPMIASVTEIRTAKDILQQVQAQLERQKIDFDRQIAIGIMIEVPSAVMMAEQLAQEVDFFSIGTNDLSQYTMAAERTNPDVASLADAFEPAVLKMIQQTAQAAHQVRIKVSVCGQMASDLSAVPILLGLGVDELSVNPIMIPQIKTAIANYRRSDGVTLADYVLKLDSAMEVRQYINNGKLSTDS